MENIALWIGIIGSVVTIFVFVTGFASLSDALRTISSAPKITVNSVWLVIGGLMVATTCFASGIIIVQNNLLTKSPTLKT